MVYKSCLKSNNIYDICRLIPKGPKYTLWFTVNKKKPVITLLPGYIDKPYKLNKIYTCCFDKLLINTLCHGTLIKYNNNNIFFIENIIKFMNTNVKKYNWIEKYNYIYKVLNMIRHDINYTSDYLHIGIPISRKANIKHLIDKLHYSIYSIEYLYKNRKNVEKNNVTYKILMIKADKKPDIYNLYNEEYIGKAHIPDYKTSVMMNSYFRNIKENSNLDYLEESDNDEEFENISPYKNVNIDTIYRFKCVLNERFNMWVPIEKLCDTD